jgi:hypothetical protein
MKAKQSTRDEETRTILIYMDRRHKLPFYIPINAACRRDIF